jgi:hypothetical protein
MRKADFVSTYPNTATRQQAGNRDRNCSGTRRFKTDSLSRHCRPDRTTGVHYWEVGLGYVLHPGFDMPPLMLTADGSDAAVLDGRSKKMILTSYSFYGVLPQGLW